MKMSFDLPRQDRPDACYRQYSWNTVAFHPEGNCSKPTDAKCDFDLEKEKGGLFPERMYWTNGQCYRSTLWFYGCKVR